MNGYMVKGRGGDLGAYAASHPWEAAAKARAAHPEERAEDMTVEEIGPARASSCGRLYVVPDFTAPRRMGVNDYGYNRAAAAVGSIMLVSSRYAHRAGLVVVTKASAQRLTTTNLDGKQERVWARSSGHERGMGDSRYQSTHLTTIIPTVLQGRAAEARRLHPGDVLEGGAEVLAKAEIGDGERKEGVSTKLGNGRGRIAVETDDGVIRVYDGTELVALA